MYTKDGFYVPNEFVEDAKRENELAVLDYLRLYMSSVKVKNPILMIDDFISRLNSGEFDGKY